MMSRKNPDLPGFPNFIEKKRRENDRLNNEKNKLEKS